MESASLRVRRGIQERHHAFVAVRNAHDQQIHDRKRGKSGPEDIFSVEARDVQHRDRDDEYFHSRAQIRLDDDQPDQNKNRSQRRKDGVLPVIDPETFGPPAQFEKPRQIKNHGELGEFGRLQAGRAQANPAMGGVRLVEKKSADQHHEHGK